MGHERSLSVATTSGQHLIGQEIGSYILETLLGYGGSSAVFLSLSEAQHYLEQISSALDYAHEHGCVHCDVKPANILLDGAGHAMLSDFGIVRLMQPEDTTVQQSMKSAETLMGTPDYISPEQA